MQLTECCFQLSISGILHCNSFVPEGHEVVLHQGQDLGVELGVAGQHLQGFIDKSETKKVEYLKWFQYHYANSFA